MKVLEPGLGEQVKTSALSGCQQDLLPRQKWKALLKEVGVGARAAVRLAGHRALRLPFSTT